MALRQRPPIAPARKTRLSCSIGFFAQGVTHRQVALAQAFTRPISLHPSARSGPRNPWISLTHAKLWRCPNTFCSDSRESCSRTAKLVIIVVAITVLVSVTVWRLVLAWGTVESRRPACWGQFRRLPRPPSRHHGHRAGSCTRTPRRPAPAAMPSFLLPLLLLLPLPPQL